jgi:hypothetical protein
MVRDGEWKIKLLLLKSREIEILVAEDKGLLHFQIKPGT